MGDVFSCSQHHGPVGYAGPMAKLPIPLSSAYHVLNPGCVVLISVGDGERDNLFPVSWNMPLCDDPPVVGVLSSREHFSFPFIERTGSFGVSVPDVRLLDAVYGCGKTTGETETDKFRRFALTRDKAEEIQAPLVAECLAHLECRVDRIVDVEGSALLIAHVLAARAEEEHFRDGVWRFDSGLSLIHHLDGPRFAVSSQVATARRPS